MQLALVLTLALSASFAPLGDEIPYARFGQTYLDAHGAKEAPAALPYDALLEKHYARGAFGLIDVAYPTAFLGDKTRIEELQRQCSALIQLQARWIELLAKDAPAAKSGVEAAGVLAKWVQGWKPGVVTKGALAEKHTLAELFGATDAERAAQERLATLLATPDVLGVAPREIKRLSIVLAPTRRDFVELLGYTGLVDTTQQKLLWTETASGWTSFWMGYHFVLALEYPSWGEDPEFRSGTPMTKFEPTGREEHTLQNAANALQWLCYGDDDATYLHQAVAMNLAIAIAGGINALEGDAVRGSTGAETKPYEKFVPGGNPKGGFLPPIPAAGGDMLKDGRWREGKGKDHFAGVLRKNQKEGWKQFSKDRPEKPDPALARDQAAHFLLLSEDGAKKGVASAPFFGPAAFEKPYPAHEMLLDYKEFFRAYKCAFFDWLQRAGDKGGPDASKAKFGELLRRVGAKDKPAFEALVLELYGVPLSERNGEKDSLEWRFLAWLAKGK
ncbi:MAG: hypothetical protein IPJ77_16835 [Planctomycetes bacterium]|nr:hypothetical protein [Planctomycetota bacterium]